MKFRIYFISLYLVTIGLYLASCENMYPETNSEDFLVKRFYLKAPKAIQNMTEPYLCTPVKLDYTSTSYIVGYEPIATMSMIHHMLIYGCETPGLFEKAWHCGEMADQHQKVSASPCRPHTHSQILYAWARDAPNLKMPSGVGFKVGYDSPIKYIVLQVHYASLETVKDMPDVDSGVVVVHTAKKLNKLAGVLLLGTAGQVPAMKIEHMETACQINENKAIYPFAYRTHTHSLGKVVSGYKVRLDDGGNFQWTLLGKRDPLTPQMFYPVFNKDPIFFGDFLAARCTMESHRNNVTKIGATRNDEMCNFYLMYYVKNGEPLSLKYCFSQGPPSYYWKDPDVGFNNIPNIDASKL